MSDQPVVEKKFIPFAPKKYGRPTLLVSLNLSIDDIVQAYKENKTLPKTAEKLGISQSSLKTYLKMANACGPRGAPRQPYPWIRTKSSIILDWFIEHRDDKLPRSTKRIAELSGFSQRQIRQFLYYRRKAAEQYLASLSSLKDLTVFLIDTQGRKIPTRMLDSYQFNLDNFDLTVKVTGSLRFGGLVHTIWSFNQACEILNQSKAARDPDN